MLRYVSMPYFANYENVRPSYCLRPLCNAQTAEIPQTFYYTTLVLSCIAFYSTLLRKSVKFGEHL